MKKKVFTYISFLLFLWVLPSLSAVYHIDPTASISGDGTAWAPFKKWSDLPKIQTGDDVFFKCNTKYETSNSINVFWGGSESNPVVIGAYFMANGLPVYGVSGERPIISGSDYTVPENICTGGSKNSWDGLIRIISKDYVHIKDLHVIKSGWYGIKFEGDLNSASSCVGFWIDNCKVDGAYSTGIAINKCKYNYGTISNCEVTLTNAGFGELKDKNGTRCDTNWGAGIGVTNSPYAYTNIKNNYVHKQWGEGISSTRITQISDANHCGYVTIEDNIVWNNRRVDVYLNLTEGNTVRRNLLIGANDSKFSSSYKDNRHWNQRGIWVNSEERPSPLTSVSNNNHVYGNLVVGHHTGIGLSNSYPTGNMENQLFYNNTVIGNRINFTIGNNLNGYQTKNIVFKNNISYCPEDTICQDVENDPTWFDSKIFANYNAWTKKPKNWGSENDIITNNNWKKVFGWQALNSIPALYEFMPTSGNSVIGNGFNLSKPFNQLVSVERTKYQFDPLKIIVGVISTNEDNKLWDIGALQSQKEASFVLNSPVLSIIPDSVAR